MTKDHMDEGPPPKSGEPEAGSPPESEEPEAGPPPESERPEEEQAPVHWAARLRSFVDEAATIAREDLANKEITFEDTVERAEKLVRKQPLAAIGIAAGMGLLAGILINRRR